MSATIISADDIKKELPGYDLSHAEEFHRESAKLADRKFDACLKTSTHQTIVLMSGGPASGKTEFVAAYLKDGDYLIFDGILPTEAGAGIKIDHIRKSIGKLVNGSAKQLKIYAVWPKDFKQAYQAFISRDRKFSDEHFYSKHASARKTLLWIAKAYPDIEIKLYTSTYQKGILSFTEIDFSEKREALVFLEKNQYSEKDIINVISS